MQEAGTKGLSSSEDVGAAGATPLARRRVPTLYGLADVLVPPAPGRPGGGDRDVAPGVARRLRHRGVAAARRAHLVLAWLEWEPVLCLRARRPFSRLPRPERAAALARHRRTRVPGVRRALAELEGLVHEALAETGVADAAAGPAGRGVQSSEGA